MLEWPLGGALCMGGGMVFDQAGGPRLNVSAPLAQAGGGDQVQNSQQPYETNDQAARALPLRQALLKCFYSTSLKSRVRDRPIRKSVSHKV
jgi:hypothetical protein